MKSFALALVLGMTLLTALSGCGDNGDRDFPGAGSGDGDYAAAITWAINGMLPTPARCQEQGIVRGRFEVKDRRGGSAQTLEADCATTVVLSDGVEFGGFDTTYAFDYDVPYLYTISLVDQGGRPLAPPVNDEFLLPYDEGDIYELPSIDFLQPSGRAAGLHAEWRVTVPGNTPIDDLNTTCTQAGIDRIYIVVTTILDPNFGNAVEFVEAKCNEGQFTSNEKVLATGAYYFRYEAVSSAGSAVQLGEPIEVDVDGSGDIVLPRETFRFN